MPRLCSAGPPVARRSPLKYGPRMMAVAFCMGGCIADRAHAQNTPADEHRAAIAALEANPGLSHHPSAILVKFRPTAGVAAQTATRARLGGRTLRPLEVVPGLEHLHVPGDPVKAVAQLRADPAVEYA